MRRAFFFILAGSGLIFSVLSQTISPSDRQRAERYADSVLKLLGPREKFSQLLMIPVYSNKKHEYVMEIIRIIRKEKPGGIIWMQGGPVRMLKLRNYFQTLSSIPLLHAIDGEWGLSMRLDSTLRFPKAMLLGAVQEDSLVYLTGKYIALECRRMGVQINFAPVVDINNNPSNPVIGLRSFGEDKDQVVNKAGLFLRGLQDHGVLACIKHFPGHGDTDTDSHLDLPVIKHSRSRLDSIELFPFRKLIGESSPASVMVGHLHVPALDSQKKQAATLSSVIVKNLLCRQMGFNGLVITDAMNMKGISSKIPAGTAEVKALKAGNDILLFVENPTLVLDSLMASYRRGELDTVQVWASCRKVLTYKYLIKHAFPDSLPTLNLYSDLSQKKVSEFIQLVNDKALTVLKAGTLLPSVDKKLIAVVFSKGDSKEKNVFVRELEKFFPKVQHENISYRNSLNQVRQILGDPDTSARYVFLITEVGLVPQHHFGIGDKGVRLLDSLVALYHPVVCLNGSPYLLNSLNTGNMQTLLLGYENTVYMQRSMAWFLAGRNKAGGKIPVSAGGFLAGEGITQLPLKFKETINPFYRVDSIVSSAIDEKAFPGCQVWVWHKGQVIYNKAYGKVTYEEQADAVHTGMAYDLASLTKILSTAFSLMVLESQGRFRAEGKTLGDYLPELKDTGKDTLPITMVLTHRAGLQAWIPFYLRTLKRKTREYKPGYYSSKMSAKYPVRVAKGLFTLKSMKDTLFKRINESSLENYGKYLYSDLGYYYMQEMIERITGKGMKEWTDSLFSEAGVQLCYLPYRKFSLRFIVPTEEDKEFRKQLLHGVVHDPGAALLGGVAGHAGLFGNAEAVGRMMLIYMLGGKTPEGKQIIDTAVVRKYTSYVYPTQCRRGLCFDKPEPDDKKSSPVHSLCSPSSFGHSGFTGTFAWADPEKQLIYVFLSNRVHPSAANDKINTLGIRGKLHRFFYEWTDKNHNP